MMNHLNPTEWILDFLLINVTHYDLWAYVYHDLDGDGDTDALLITKPEKIKSLTAKNNLVLSILEKNKNGRLIKTAENNKIFSYLEKLYECKNTSIKILPIKQTLKLHTAWINLDYAVYNGKLDDKYSIVFSDINGDGVNDLIIQTGKKGAYGGPSYNIYLYWKGKFIYNRPLSQLTVGANSLFRANGNILTVGKTSGCCKYNKFTYNLHNDAVQLVRKETEVCESSSNECQFKSKNF